MAESKTLSVSQLNGYIKSVFEDELILHNIGVYGELSQLSVRDNATYFTITEGDCYLNCVMFAAMEKLQPGTQVRAYGRVTFYAKSGKINFCAKSVTPAGKGALRERLLKLKEQLSSEGLFDNRPQPPVYIRSAAVITSSAGAVIHDIMSVIRDKGVDVGVRLIPSAVQGDNAAAAVIEALSDANLTDCDVIVIARGGGSNYDLEAFNDEALARAVAASRLPVISAVGHETDYTLCDCCAGRRAGTPSIAAGMIADVNLSFTARLSGAYGRLNQAVGRIFSEKRNRAVGAASSVIHSMDNRVQLNMMTALGCVTRAEKAIGRLYALNESRLRGEADGLNSALDGLKERYDNRLAATAQKLDYLSPLKTLGRGYARVKKGNIDVGGVGELKPSDEVKLIMRDGVAGARITDIRVLKER